MPGTGLVRRAPTGAAVIALLCLLSGCGSSGTDTARLQSSGGSSAALEPFTHEQQLVVQGARLVVADGCSACHLDRLKQSVSPSFASFAGHEVTLANGKRALVEEDFVREGLLHPGSHELKGYEPDPMLDALARLHLQTKPAQVDALAAFIEQIGPEPE
jgi:hypothetical protein